MAASSDRQIEDIRDLWADEISDAEPVETVPATELEALVIETIEALAAKGVGADDLKPLTKLQSAVRSFAAEHDDEDAAERREGAHPASDALLARVCVVIDLLIQAGYGHDKAVQMMARQLMVSGVVLPDSGGDARGWKRLADWHGNLVYGMQSPEAVEAQATFKEDLNAIPAAERLTRVLEHRLWDSRAAR